MTDESESTENGEEEIVPGRNAGEIVGHAPHDDEGRDGGGDRRRRKAQGDRIGGWYEEEEKREKNVAYREEVRPEQVEGGGVEKTQAAGVDLVEIAMR